MFGPVISRQRLRLIIEKQIVRHEALAAFREQTLDHRMTAAGDQQIAALAVGCLLSVNIRAA